MNDRIQEIKRRHAEEQAELDATAGTYVRQEHQDMAYLLSEVERLQEENKDMKEALEWTRKRFDEEWTYELGTGEVVDEILTKFDTALFRLKDKP